jgi:mannose-6-phosphate isomerase-like protein (cupin superfamily)
MPIDDPLVARAADRPESPIDEGCLLRELWNEPADAAVSIARARLAPGRVTKLHRLRGIVERYVILSGRGLVSVGALESEVVPGDVVFIPEGVSQRIAALGDTDLVFDCVCTPRFTPECYDSLE